MTQPGTSRKGPARSRLWPFFVLGSILGILALAILLTTLHLRRAMRQQIIQQDGIALHAASFVKPSLLEGLGTEITSDPELSFAALADQMFETASAGGALAVRVFDERGQLEMATPVPAAARQLDVPELAAVRNFQPFSSFDAAAEMSDFGLDSGEGPVVRTLVPLKAEGKFVGAAEFVLDGRNVARALAELDEDLWRWSSVMFVAGSAIISLSLGWAYRRLIRSNQLLSERTQSLLRANHELTLAAKTSAIGAIAAHLIHDLKNPLFGLQSFVSTRGMVDQEDWDLAANAADRMQNLIGEIVRILHEEKTTESYNLSAEELFNLLRAKVGEDAERSGVEFVVTTELEGTLLNRNANIILLILTNLTHNAFHATPRGGQVQVSLKRTATGGSFEISDTGNGLPAHILPTLFTPSKSTKSGGTGLGLAISKHLANHIGAELCLKQSTREGTTFELRIPEHLFVAHDLAAL